MGFSSFTVSREHVNTICIICHSTYIFKLILNRSCQMIRYLNRCWVTFAAVSRSCCTALSMLPTQQWSEGWRSRRKMTRYPRIVETAACTCIRIQDTHTMSIHRPCADTSKNSNAETQFLTHFYIVQNWKHEWMERSGHPAIIWSFKERWKWSKFIINLVCTIQNSIICSH